MQSWVDRTAVCVARRQLWSASAACGSQMMQRLSSAAALASRCTSRAIADLPGVCDVTAASCCCWIAAGCSNKPALLQKGMLHEHAGMNHAAYSPGCAAWHVVLLRVTIKLVVAQTCRSFRFWPCCLCFPSSSSSTSSSPVSMARQGSSASSFASEPYR